MPALARMVSTVVADDQRLQQVAQDPVGHRVGDLVVRQAGEQHHELVSAQPGDGVIGTDVRVQPLGRGAQQCVAGRVPVGVVDSLEPVQVDQDHRGHRVVGIGQRVGGVVDEQLAVAQLGQRVAERLPGQDGALPGEVAHQAGVGAGTEELPDQDDRRRPDEQPGQLGRDVAVPVVPPARHDHRGGDWCVLQQRPPLGQEDDADAEEHDDADRHKQIGPLIIEIRRPVSISRDAKIMVPSTTRRTRSMALFCPMPHLRGASSAPGAAT